MFPELRINRFSSIEARPSSLLGTTNAGQETNMAFRRIFTATNEFFARCSARAYTQLFTQFEFNNLHSVYTAYG